MLYKIMYSKQYIMRKLELLQFRLDSHSEPGLGDIEECIQYKDMEGKTSQPKTILQDVKGILSSILCFNEH